MFLNLITVKLTTRIHIHIAMWEQLPTLNKPQSSTKPSPKTVYLTSHVEFHSKSCWHYLQNTSRIQPLLLLLRPKPLSVHLDY